MAGLTKESRIELQYIDCNCNDCKHLFRLLDKQNNILSSSKVSDEETFYTVKDNKEKDIRNTIASLTKHKEIIPDAERKIDKHKNRLELLLAEKYVYQGSKAPNQYGVCCKFNKQVTFIPNTCQIETQGCFKHRRDL